MPAASLRSRSRLLPAAAAVALLALLVSLEHAAGAATGGAPSLVPQLGPGIGVLTFGHSLDSGYPVLPFERLPEQAKATQAVPAPPVAVASRPTGGATHAVDVDQEASAVPAPQPLPRPTAQHPGQVVGRPAVSPAAGHAAAREAKHATQQAKHAAQQAKHAAQQAKHAAQHQARQLRHAGTHPGKAHGKAHPGKRAH